MRTSCVMDDYVEGNGKERHAGKIDRRLSSREATVFVNEETNTVTVSFKGTGLSGEDLAADVALFDNKA